jgi:type VI secretion system protein ImpL
LAEDAGVRDYTRQYLQKIKGVDRIYRRILADAEKGAAKPQRLEDLAANYRQVLNGPAEVSAAFTREGWRMVQKASKDATAGGLGDSCVVGNTSGILTGLKRDADVERAIQQRYIHDYIEAWQRFVAGFSVIQYKGAADAAQKLDILASNRSPLLAMLAMTANQTNFSPTTEAGMVERAGKALGDLVKTGEQKVNQLTESGKDKREISSTSDITRFFQPVRYVVPAASERWINEKNSTYMDALAGLRGAIQAKARSSADTPDPQLDQVAVQSVDKAEESVRQLAKGFNPDGVGVLDHEVTRLLEEPIKNARPFLILPPPKLDSKVGPELQKFCSSFQALLRKYPFNPTALEPPAGSEVTLKDVESYFAPEQGAIWKFQHSALAEFTILDGGVWKQNPAAQKLKASQELLDFLNRSQEITKAFFADGATSPHLSYTLRPILEQNSEQLISLKIDGQLHEFSRNSVRQQQFTWPAASGKQQEAVGRSGIVGFTTGFSSHEGVWAVFRMFGDAEPRSLKEASLQWMRTKGPTGRFQTMDTPVKLDFVVFPGGVDAFNPKFFEGFRCPSKAVQ